MLTVLDLANEDTKLHKESVREQAGPCPDPSCRCQTDGFRVKRSGDTWVFMCRGCWDSEEWLPGRQRKRGWGDAIDYLRHYRHMNFRVAKALVDGQESTLPASSSPFVEQSLDQAETARAMKLYQERLWQPDDSQALDYIRSRGLSDDIIRWAQMGYSLKEGIPRLVIPSINERRYVAVYRRDIRPDTPHGQRWKDAGGSSKDEFYLADCLVRKLPTIVVESALDALLIIQECGREHINVVATAGTKGARSVKSLSRLALMPLVLIAFDADEDGDEKAPYWLERLPNARRLRPLLHDINDMLLAGWDIHAWVNQALGITEDENDLAETCTVCGREVECFSDAGIPYCSAHLPVQQPAPPPVPVAHQALTREELADYAQTLARSSIPGRCAITIEPRCTLVEHVERLNALKREEYRQRATLPKYRKQQEKAG